MESVKPIQILTPVNHKHELGVQNLKEILEQREIKDRFIVAFSIVGAFRKAISFLLNFFLKYLYAQVSRVFNSDSLPEPKSVLMATDETSNQILYSDCLKLYCDSMQNQIKQKSNDEMEPYFVKSVLNDIHGKAKGAALQMFQDTRKLGGSEIIETFQNKLLSSIQMNFNKFDEENDDKKTQFEAMAAANIQILYDDCLKTYVDSMQKDFNTVESYLSMDSLFQLHARMQNESLSKFQIEKKLGGEELIANFQRKLKANIENKYNDFKQENDNKKRQFEAVEAGKKAKTSAQERANEEARLRAEEDAKHKADSAASQAKISNLIKANKKLEKEIKVAKKGRLLRAIGAIAGIVTGVLLSGPLGAIEGAKMGEKVFDKQNYTMINESNLEEETSN